MKADNQASRSDWNQQLLYPICQSSEIHCQKIHQQLTELNKETYPTPQF
jgi:hypothetical protein